MNSKNLYTTPSSSSTTLFLAVFFSTLISLLASFATIAAEDEAVSISASTQWINELGSVLTITTIDSTGLLNWELCEQSGWLSL